MWPAQVRATELVAFRGRMSSSKAGTAGSNDLWPTHAPPRSDADPTKAAVGAGLIGAAGLGALAAIYKSLGVEQHLQFFYACGNYFQNHIKTLGWESRHDEGWDDAQKELADFFSKEENIRGYLDMSTVGDKIDMQEFVEGKQGERDTVLMHLPDREEPLSFMLSEDHSKWFFWSKSVYERQLIALEDVEKRLSQTRDALATVATDENGELIEPEGRIMLDTMVKSFAQGNLSYHDMNEASGAFESLAERLYLDNGGDPAAYGEDNNAFRAMMEHMEARAKDIGELRIDSGLQEETSSVGITYEDFLEQRETQLRATACDGSWLSFFFGGDCNKDMDEETIKVIMERTAEVLKPLDDGSIHKASEFVELYAPAASADSLNFDLEIPLPFMGTNDFDDFDMDGSFAAHFRFDDESFGVNTSFTHEIGIEEAANVLGRSIDSVVQAH